MEEEKVIMKEVGKYKKLIEEFPFLMPRNVFTDEIPDDFNYSYHIGLNIPEGWTHLFLQMCQDIKQPLIDANYLNDFRFTQIKEKYGAMRCYTNEVPKKVQSMISKYEYMSRYVCALCGQPAHYKTLDYILPICEQCWKDKLKEHTIDPIEFCDHYKITHWNSDGEEWQETISIKDEWEQYIKEKKYEIVA